MDMSKRETIGNKLLKRRKRALKSSLFAVMAAICMWCGIGGIVSQADSGQVSAGEGEFQDAPIALDAVYGYQNIAKGGRFLPLEISLNNQSEEDFTGTLCILAMESDYQGYNMNQEYEVYRYEYPVTLKKGENLVKNESVSLGARVDQMYIRLLDHEGNEIGSKRLKLNLNLDTAELFIGLLSDNPGDLLYLNGVGINYSTLRTRVIEMSADTLPSSGLGLDQLDVLLITDFDTSTLSEEQMEAVWEWVQGGGVLLVGTGGRGADTMSGFSDELLEVILPAPEERVINMGVEYAKNRPEEASIPLMCTEVLLKGATEILGSDELSVLSSIRAGQGLVAVSVYDFRDIEEFCQINPSYVDNLFASLLGEERINALASFSEGSTSRQYWAVQNLINTGNVNKLPKVSLYVVLAIAYVALAGPGLYFFWKQRGMGQYYQPSVAVLSLICTGMVYFMGTGTRFTGPFFNYAAIKDIDGGEVEETIFINMRSPYNKPYSVTLAPEYSLSPVTGGSYYNSDPAPDFTGREEPDVTIRYDEDGTRIKMGSVGAFNSKFFMLERRTEKEGEEGFTGDIHSFDGKVTGTLTNNYSQAVDNAAIILYNQIVPVGHMEAGETVVLDDLPVTYGITGFGYAMAEQITGGMRYKENKDVRDSSYVQALERTNLLSFYMENYLSGYHSEARVVAFSNEKEEKGFLGTGDSETYGSALLTSSIEVDTEKDGMVYRSALQKQPNVLSGDYYASNNSIYGMTPVMLEYYLGSDLQVETLSFHQMSDVVAESMRYYYTVPFSGSIYFYNYNTSSYDSMDPSVTTYSREELEDYLSPGNTLTVKYMYSGTGEYTWNIMLPILTVTGRGK